MEDPSRAISQPDQSEGAKGPYGVLVKKLAKQIISEVSVSLADGIKKLELQLEDHRALLRQQTAVTQTLADQVAQVALNGHRHQITPSAGTGECVTTSTTASSLNCRQDIIDVPKSVLEEISKMPSCEHDHHVHVARGHQVIQTIESEEDDRGRRECFSEAVAEPTSSTTAQVGGHKSPQSKLFALEGSRKTEDFGREEEEEEEDDVTATKEALVKDMEVYKDTGVAQMIARNPFFDSFSILVVFANAVCIGLDAQFNEGSLLRGSTIGWTLVDNFFCIYFLFEWVVRFTALSHKSQATKSRLFVFDTVLVVMIVLETWALPGLFLVGIGGDNFRSNADKASEGIAPLQMLKLCRLLRLARMGRLLRSFPEVVAMMKGVVIASRSVGSVAMLLFSLLYIFAVLIYIMLKDADYEADSDIAAYYGSLLKVMWTLLTQGAFMEGVYESTQCLLEERQYGAFIAFCVFVILSAFTVMNLLIGVLCDVVNKVTTAEKEEQDIRSLQKSIMVTLKELDDDDSGLLSKQEIQEVFEEPGAMKVLKELNVDVNHLVDSMAMHFEFHSEIGMSKVVDLILMMRGDRLVTMKDINYASTFTRWKITAALKRSELRIEKFMQAMGVEHDFHEEPGHEVFRGMPSVAK